MAGAKRGTKAEEKVPSSSTPCPDDASTVSRSGGHIAGSLGPAMRHPWRGRYLRMAIARLMQ